MVDRIVPLLSYLIKIMITTTTIATTRPSIPPVIGPTLLSEALVERIVPLLSYLIKITRMTTTTIATTTPPTPPAIGSMLLV